MRSLSCGRPREPINSNMRSIRSTAASRPCRGGRRKNGYTAGAGWPTQNRPVVDMIETSERTASGCLAASVWAIMPPIDAPTTWAGARSSSRSRPAASPAMSASVYDAPFLLRRAICPTVGGGAATWVERPQSRLSNRTTWNPRAGELRAELVRPADHLGRETHDEEHRRIVRVAELL